MFKITSKTLSTGLLLAALTMAGSAYADDNSTGPVKDDGLTAEDFNNPNTGKPVSQCEIEFMEGCMRENPNDEEAARQCFNGGKWVCDNN